MTFLFLLLYPKVSTYCSRGYLDSQEQIFGMFKGFQQESGGLDVIVGPSVCMVV